MSELSPAARSVFESFNSKFDWLEDGVPGPQLKSLAAALRATADQVVPYEQLKGCDQEAWQRDDIRNEILAIADELEAQ